MPAIATETAEVVIARDADNDIKMRGLEIYVDGQFTHDLPFNGTMHLELPLGPHTIMVSNHLYKKSLDLNLKAGDKVELVAGNNFTLIGGLMVSVLGMGPYRVFLRQNTRPQAANVVI